MKRIHNNIVLQNKTLNNDNQIVVNSQIIKIKIQAKMDKIKKILQDPYELGLAVSGLGLLAFYYFYARKQLLGITKKKEQNSLQLSLQELVKHDDGPNICKIVITQPINSNTTILSSLITKLKQFLLKNGLHTLVNCSPLKLFNASSQVFVSTLTQQDADDQLQFMSYFENSLKCQLSIERTIIDIQKIKNKDQQTYIICDTNSLDLKAQSDQKLWKKFLEEENINQEHLKNHYQIVFHICTNNTVVSPKLGPKNKNQKYAGNVIKSDDDKIRQAWQGFKNYHQISVNPELTTEQNIQQALQTIITKLKPLLPKDIPLKNAPSKSLEQ